MTASEKLAMIESALATGKTVYVGTMTRCTKITAKCAAAWKTAGKPFFKVADNSLYMIERRAYVCADYVGIRIA